MTEPNEPIQEAPDHHPGAATDAVLIRPPSLEEPDYLRDAPLPTAASRVSMRMSALDRKRGRPDGPTAPHLERMLMSAALQDPCVFTIDLDPGDFHDGRFRAIWRIGQQLILSDQPCDMPLVERELRRDRPDISLEFLQQLQELNALPQNAEAYAGYVRDLARRRRAVAELKEAELTVWSADGAWSDALAACAARLAKLALDVRQSTDRKATSWTAAELLAGAFPDPQWAVPGLIPVGLSFLGGRPKVGKSYLALQIAIAKGTGGQIFDRQVEQGTALYIALEDNGRRLRDRVQKQGMPATAQARFETTWPRLTDGGLERLEQEIDAAGYKLVVIDTLGRAVGRVDLDDYSETTALLGSLQEVAMSREMSILVVDHHRKGMQGVEDDTVDAIMGSTGKAAAADAVLGLTRQQGKPGARLRVRGRELEDADLVLTWDPEGGCWQCQGTAEEAEMSGRRGQVLAVLEATYPESMLAADIAKAADMQRGNLNAILNDLICEGRVVKAEKKGREQPYLATRSNAETP